ncbi:MAG TPA: tetratricopeptide repeat protein [Phycisphaerae bacterium]|nr:tetratricopeptide repeat protein [Phycisphaerae bacterium]
MSTKAQPEKGQERCRPRHPAPPRALPVVAAKADEIRPGKIGRWRTGVLIGLHVLIAIHVAHWLSSGRTLSPLEPSEAMEFVKHGLVNAGLIFFALAIVSTLVLGRWVCGWGCHLVALQDLARWMLKQAGIRPRPLRSRVLGLVPLLAFLYMFVAPLLSQWLAGRAFEVRGWALTREEFWETFPTWTPAILTFLICGFVIIYFLGQKGFCTNACPYGGIFGVADQLAPLRIRVTDACDQCGHCTAVCTSNVRVHEEVRDFKAVVDPGCMKCLDCVHVCPNEALYVGWGAPAVLTPPRAAAATAAAGPSAARAEPRRLDALPWVALAAFSFLSLLLFASFDRSFAWHVHDVVVAAVLAAAALLIAFLLPARSARRSAFNYGDELILAGAFLAALLAFRGLYGMVAFLFALGLAALIALLVLRLVRLPGTGDVMLHNLRLRSGGRLQPAGHAFVLGMALLAALWAHSMAVQHYAHAVARESAALAPAMHRGDPLRASAFLTDGERARLDRALAGAALLERWRLLREPAQDLTHARLCLLAGRHSEYERRLAQVVERRPAAREPRFELAGYYAATGRTSDALRQYERYCERRPRDERGHAYHGLALASLGEWERARAALDRGLKTLPRSALLLMNRGLVEAEAGDLSAALPWLERAVAADPNLPQAVEALAQAREALRRGAGGE